jgi:osmotically-inducible protein OsmY
MKTDSQLQNDVIAELKWQPSVHASQIGVSVKDGVVTLSGEVSSYVEKIDAERAAQRVTGVKALAVGMEVKLSAFGKRDDADIARSADNVLEWMTSASDSAIKVMVEKGWVTLSGDVDWQYQKLAAAQSIRHLMGVTGVSNQISIKPKISMSMVKTEIEAALARRAKVDAAKISVEVQGNSVTLTGAVNSWSERDSATSSAWGTPGVHNVIDKMTLAIA